MLCPPILAAQSVASTASAVGSTVSAVSDAAGTVNTIADNISPLLGGKWTSRSVSLSMKNISQR